MNPQKVNIKTNPKLPRLELIGSAQFSFVSMQYDRQVQGK